MVRGWRERAGPYLLSEKCTDVGHLVVAAVVVDSHARWTGGRPVVTTACGHLRVAPCPTE